MKFIHRLGYYLGGFSLGLVILAFFLAGKKSSCAYGPNARTIKNISGKQLYFSEDTKSFMVTYHLDSSNFKNLIRMGDVDFSRSKTHLDSCKFYIIDSKLDGKDVEMSIENCAEQAKIRSMHLK